MAKRNRKIPRILKRFLFSYSIIIILPLLVGLVSYKESVNIISKDTKNYSISMLQQSMEMLDRIIAETDRITYQISVNPQVIKFCYMYDFTDTSMYYKMWETLSYIKPYSNYSDTGLDYSIYFCKTDMVFNSNSAFHLVDYYNLFNYEDIDIAEFRQRFLNTCSNGSFIPAMTVNVTEITTTGRKVSKYNVITYLKSMPTMANGTINAMIFVQIKEDTILKFLSGLDVSDNGSVYILDENSNFITGIPNSIGKSTLYDIDFKGNEGFVKKNIDGKSIYITYTVSSYNGWKYVFAVPSHIVMAKVNSIRNLILGITVASLIIGIILLILLSYANSKPIIELKKTLLDFLNTEDDNKKGEFYFLKTSVSALIHQSSAMKSDIQRQRSTLQKSVIERLLLGKNINLDILERASQSGVELNAKAYTCVLINMNNVHIENNQLQELNLGQIIHMQTGHKGYLIDIDKATLCLLLCFNTQDNQTCKQHIETVISWLYTQIQQSCNFAPTFAIGSIYHELNDIYRSYNEAKQALAFMPIQTPSTLLWYSCLEMDTRSSYFYPTELEQRLIHLVKHGYKEDISNLLSTILQKNLEKPIILNNSQILLRNEINGTIYKLNIANTENIIAELDNFESLVDVFKHLQTLLNNLCNDVNKQKNNHSIELVEKIISYFQSNYSDPNISLCQVALKFKFSEGYISQLFKDHTGEQFSTYLESIRLDHACELLEKNSYTINEIAFKSGYNSPQSFRRAFKRVKGYNPTDFKVDELV